MTGGRGISHSEVSTDAEAVLHGAQLWVALPDAARETAPGFAHHAPQPIAGPGWTVRVFIGSLLGEVSPVPTYTPLLGAEVLLEPSTSLTLPVEESFEHGVLVDTGGAALATDKGDATLVAKDRLAYVPPGASALTLEAGGSWTRLLLLGGPPFGESIVMWWNFVGRSHEDVVAYREAWQAAITGADGQVVADSQLVSDSRFGVVVGDHLPPIPAPPLPGVRLRSRR
jgi:redox-sensitive bicupin YhaK (pirin superfamily)